MPLVAHNSLPAFEVLKNDGHVVLSLERAKKQDIRELHIGLLNMMPDAALAATERQFIRLIGSSNPIAQFFVYPFSLRGLERDQRVTEARKALKGLSLLRDIERSGRPKGTTLYTPKEFWQLNEAASQRLKLRGEKLTQENIAFEIGEFSTRQQQRYLERFHNSKPSD